MKVLIVLATVISVVLSVPMCLPQEETSMFDDIGPNIEYLLVADKEKEGAYIVEDLVSVDLSLSNQPSESDLTYYFYSKNNPNQATVLKYYNINLLADTEFNTTKDTLLIIHGWSNNYQSDINVLIKNAVLKKHDVNIFVVDWSPIASGRYVDAKAAVPNIGKYVAYFLQSLQAVFGLQLSKVSIVGHSLGAHVSGAAGAVLSGVLNHIVGLDPALPLFSLNNTNRLDKTDAKFVQVIHTCGNLLGFAAPIGHSDYYPNGGLTQPGCGWDPVGECAHSRAYIYYAESIDSSDTVFANSFSAKECSNYKAYTSGFCSNNLQSNMGGYKIDTGASGNYYLTTNRKPPYSRD